MLLRARNHQVLFPRRPLVMGIININDDSFSGDGSLDLEKALAQAHAFIAAGADIIDIGAESARTNRGAISEGEEITRVKPFLEKWSHLVASFQGPAWDSEQLWPPLLSINTWRSKVIEEVLPLGGDIINDISGLPDARNAQLCARHGAALLIMHSVGEPKVPHTHVTYPDVVETVEAFFQAKLALAIEAGLPTDQIILDPGIDFAKQKDDNLILYRDLERFQRLGRPVLLPVSRKTVIGEVLGIKVPAERDAGTVACIVAGMRRGAQIFRVHNVKAAAQAVKVLWEAEKRFKRGSEPTSAV
ncbi:MAG: dihydropteroate synthase [Verrucomicrobium sp.]|nr:dihydropteroate synthase [Verrucomicrobium sp.]